MKKPSFSDHHILAKSRNGSNLPVNIVRLIHSFHVRWHVLMENKTPSEQLKVFREVNGKAFLPEVNKKIDEILSWGEYIYKDGVLRPKHTNDS